MVPRCLVEIETTPWWRLFIWRMKSCCHHPVAIISTDGKAIGSLQNDRTIVITLLHSMLNPTFQWENRSRNKLYRVRTFGFRKPYILLHARWGIDIKGEPYKSRLKTTAIRNIRLLVSKVLVDTPMSLMKSIWVVQHKVRMSRIRKWIQQLRW